MLVYNIRREKYAGELSASGIANRWNRKDEYVIYTGYSVSLSVLELVAHRNAIQINAGYKLLIIELPITQKDITSIKIEDLPKNWRSIESYPALQKMGSAWYQNRSTLLLEVPSALVPQEKNYLISTMHPSFAKKVRLKAVEDFNWDKRLLGE